MAALPKGSFGDQVYSADVPAKATSMSDAEIDQARIRLKQLAKKGPPPEDRKNGSLAIVEKLYEEIAAARAAGWTWERIRQGIGDKVANWKPKTLERYFQLIKKVHGGKEPAPKQKMSSQGGRVETDAGKLGSEALSDSPSSPRKGRYDPDVA